ncbi:MAG: lysophospholipid acyltransferase family protein, partial [Candidatus Omnitrophica bacterium]|nr:lysophospholipid acyltransferase family protein [Candidatus Omnitrophota bacterium]
MYYLFYLGRVLALLIPRRVCYFLAKIIALIYYNFSRSDRKAVLSNLSPIIDDEKTRIVTARKVFINFAYYLVDFFRYRKLDLSFIEKYVVISGLDNLNRCFAENKGVVLLSAHLGNYELGGAVLALLGYPFCALALPHRDKRVNRFFDNQRNLVGVEVIPTGGVSRRCLSSLRKGKIVAFLGDRDFSGKGVRTAVGNSYSFLPKGPAFFSFKTGAYILPV